MFYFDLEKSAILQAVHREKEVRIINFFKKIFFILFLLSFLVFSVKFLTGFSLESHSKTFGLSLIFLVLTLAFWQESLFFDSRLKKPKLKFSLKEVISNPEKFNLAELLSFEVAKIVFQTIKYARVKRISEVNSLILFYFLLKEKDNYDLNFIFNHALLSQNYVLKILETHFQISKKEGFQGVFSEDFQKVILESLKIAQEKKHQRIETGDILTAFSEYDLIFKKILIDLKLKTEDIKNLTRWIEFLKEKEEERKKFWKWKNLLKIGSIAKEWTTGYTITLDQFSTDLSKEVQRMGFPEIIGHQKEIEAMERILAKREASNDPLIVGEAGSGRKSMIWALVKKSALGESLPEVNYKRIVQLNLQTLLSQLESLEAVESVLDKIFSEVVSAGNVILVIDEFHNFVGRGKMPKPGAIDISGILTPYISSPFFQVIAITTFEGLHRGIEQNPSLLAFFEKVEVSEISRQEALILLERLALKLEIKFKKLISYPALRDIINFCEKYIPITPFPEKATNLLEEIMIYLAQSRSGERILLPRHVAKVVSEKIQVPVGEIESVEKEILLNLENLIHQRIINQEEAVKEISSALRRARAEITIRKGPIGSFLFLGPTGVGKTETSKALAEVYFGSETRMIRMDMSEFQNVEDVPRLIGSPDEEGLLTTPVRENPFSLILLDEIEKAHQNILNLFLQVLDEGHLTDGLGRKVDFKNTIIISTSNAGYQVILEVLKEKIDWQKVKERVLNYCFEKGIFRPEFINRFDAVVCFGPLSRENLLEIAELMLKKIKKKLAEKEIEFIITPSLKEKIVEMGYNPTFGAREMQRAISDRVGNPLAEAILRAEIKRGDRIKIDEKFQVVSQ